jgi:hypothetical protein
LEIIIMSPPSASTSSRAPSASIFTSWLAQYSFTQRTASLYARQFDDAAKRSHLFADSFVALLVGHVHAAGIRRNADMVGDKDQQRIGIWILAVVLDRSQLVVIRSAAEKRLHAAHEKHLEWRHQRWRARAIENFGEVSVGEIKVEQAEIAQVAGYEMLENGFPELLAEESFITHKDVSRPQLLPRDLGNEAFRLGKGLHQKPSRTLLTRVCAKSRESRPMAGESSSKKLLTSCETWYCSRNTYDGF